MAKKSWLARNKKKLETVKKFAALRAELKAKGDYAGLSQSASRVHPEVRRLPSLVPRGGLAGTHPGRHEVQLVIRAPIYIHER